MLKKKYFKTKDECEVTFQLEYEKATEVELVCAANDWEPIPMKRLKAGGFKATMRLPKNTETEFRYRVDKTLWVNDDGADAYRTNEHGSENSVLITAEG